MGSTDWIQWVGRRRGRRIGEAEEEGGEREKEKEEGGGNREEELRCYVGWRHTGGVGGAMIEKKKNELNNPSLLFCLFLGV